MSEFLAGLNDHLRALPLLRSRKVWPLVIIPGLVSLVYFPAILAVTFLHAPNFANHVRNNWLPQFLSHPAFSWLIAAALWILLLYLGFILFRNVIMILYAPGLGLLSARVEKEYRGAPLQQGEAGLFHGALRGIGMSLLSLLLSVAVLTCCVLLLLIPVLGGLLFAVMMACTQMFFAGQGFIDPTLERHGYGVVQGLGFAWHHKRRLLGCGCGFVLLAAVPIVGWFLGPALGIAAGTLAALDLERAESKLVAG